jgi:hypothetical protein
MDDALERIEFLELRLHQVKIQLQGLECAIAQIMRLIYEPIEEPPPIEIKNILPRITEI